MSTPMSELLARARAAAVAVASTPTPTSPHIQFADDIELNIEQQAFRDLVLTGKDCVLIGAAGTGKTTCLKAVIQALAQLPTATLLKGDHKHLVEGTPSTILTSFTRRAVNNLKRAVSADFKTNCITLHKLLEYEPNYFDIIDPETGEERTTMRFEPARNIYNPLDPSIRTIVTDEASMVSLELEEEVNIALGSRIQRIYLGDINQLPPVFGSAVLGYRMQELPVIELTQIYRQAANSPIIKYATAIKNGETFSFTEKHTEVTTDGKITFHPWKKRISGEDALATSAVFLKKAIDVGAYDPDEHMVLCPFNKAFGTLELNRHIANHLARKRGAVTHEVIAGFLAHYFSIGDRVMYDKEDAVIISINKNGGYAGSKRPKLASTTLDYWGCEQGDEAKVLAAKQVLADEENALGLTEEDVEKMLADMSSGDSGDRVTAASHVITLRMIDSDQEVVLESAASINGMLLGYALTTHKAQGAEWSKVFVLYHQSHATMLCREQLYTAITRAREECYIICEQDTFVKGVQSQRIKGNTLAEKAEYFKGKINGMK
jgi:ATP-dependent exoDNAse (exonuclease V) alpha subunit